MCSALLKFRSVTFLLIIMSMIGCASVEKPRVPFVPPVYPAPPDEPRFIYESTLRHSAQITVNAKEARLKMMLTGVSAAGQSHGLAKPFDVEVCQGRVYVSDTGKRLVHVFDYPNKTYSQIGQESPGELVKPMGLALDAQCRLYVVDATRKSIVIYNPDGSFVDALGGKEWFHRLSYVAVNREGTRVYGVDIGQTASSTVGHVIRVFDVESGDHLYDIGSRGSADGELNLPRDIAIGADGRIHVVDSGNFRVQIFEADGTFVRKFGSVGKRMGQFSRPKGIALDADGNIYVSDTSFGNIQIFNSEGELLMFVGGRANQSAPGKYLLPAGLDVDEDGRIYYAGQFFRKVDIFRPYALKKEQGYLGAFYRKAAE